MKTFTKLMFFTPFVVWLMLGCTFWKSDTIIGEMPYPWEVPEPEYEEVVEDSHLPGLGIPDLIRSLGNNIESIIRGRSDRLIAVDERPKFIIRRIYFMTTDMEEKQFEDDNFKALIKELEAMLEVWKEAP